MGLTPSSRLGPYKILSPLGAGGMGEVYSARDTKLGRDVALKVLPEAFASNADRLARFRREAQVLASLNHPNIATILGLEEANGNCALVMELVEGATLAEKIGVEEARHSGPAATRDEGPRRRTRAFHYKSTNACLSPSRLPRGWSTHTSAASSIATSSPPT